MGSAEVRQKGEEVREGEPCSMTTDVREWWEYSQACKCEIVVGWVPIPDIICDKGSIKDISFGLNFTIVYIL